MVGLPSVYWHVILKFACGEINTDWLQIVPNLSIFEANFCLVFKIIVASHTVLFVASCLAFSVDISHRMHLLKRLLRTSKTIMMVVILQDAVFVYFRTKLTKKAFSYPPFHPHSSLLAIVVLKSRRHQ